ncbi:MAG: AAA family ATPase [Candidatus Levybacteria bacterium]|nr:AAA family ATPase [Candidatus Levybacteria bacterium]
MRYLSFTISDYKAISGNLEVDISKRSLLPIIGINESGKTSILWAIFAFDLSNDSLNDGRQLINVRNLYKTTDQGVPSVTAKIEISKEECLSIHEQLGNVSGLSEDAVRELTEFKEFVSRVDQKTCYLFIKRDLINKQYSIKNQELENYSNINTLLIDTILRKTPHILYFDDFRDTVQEEMEIVGENNQAKGWLEIIEQLFRKTNNDYSVFKLKEIEELTRQSILGDACKVLNQTLAKEWEKFTLEKGARLDVQIDYSLKEERPFLKLLVKETIEGKERYFGIRDRSKGFYWFFNFVMKLEFNPKVRSMEDKDTIYLLDEPGSYLHSSAQSKLCEKLSYLSSNNVVIYCTHSHYLLDPSQIPLNSVRVAQKSSNGSISILSLLEYKDNSKEKRLAVQPIIDALKIKPFITDFNFESICIVEGIYDFYCFELFKPKTLNLGFLPSVNAESISYFISISIGWRLKYLAMWDNDVEGQREFENSMKFFGDEEGKKFLLLPLNSKSRKKTILQDLFEGQDIRLIRSELAIPNNTSFEKTIATLYFSKKVKAILKKLSKKTHANFEYVYDTIIDKINTIYEV